MVNTSVSTKLNPEARMFSLLNPNIAEFVPTLDDEEPNKLKVDFCSGHSQENTLVSFVHKNNALMGFPREDMGRCSPTFSDQLSEENQLRPTDTLITNTDAQFQQDHHFMDQSHIDESNMFYYEDSSLFPRNNVYISDPCSPSLTPSQSWSNLGLFSPETSPQMGPLVSCGTPPPSEWSLPSTPNYSSLPLTYRSLNHTPLSSSSPYPFQSSPLFNTCLSHDPKPYWSPNPPLHNNSHQTYRYSIRELLRFRNGNIKKPVDWPEHIIIKLGKGVDEGGKRNKKNKKRDTSIFVRKEHRRSRSSTLGTESGSLRRLNKHHLKRGHSNSTTNIEDLNISSLKPPCLIKQKSAPAKLSMPQALKHEKEQALTKFRVILNKLTPEKFETLVANALNVQITTPQTLGSVIDTIYDKAVYEPAFAAIYAQLCTRLARKFSEFETQSGNKMNFRLILLKKCFNQMIKEEDHSALPDMEKQEKQKKAKNKQKGNIILIGELFKHKLLNSAVVHLYIDMLLNDIDTPDDNDIASLCYLLGTVGKDLDNCSMNGSKMNSSKVNGSKMDGYIAKMKILSESKVLSLRFRCLVKDIIELRERKWIHRIEKSFNPKTIKEIRDVFAKSNKKSNQQSSSISNSPNTKNKTHKKKLTNTTNPQNPSRCRKNNLSCNDNDKGLQHGHIKNRNIIIGSNKKKKHTDTMSNEQINNKLKNLLNEYYCSQDIDEACLCLSEIDGHFSDNQNARFNIHASCIFFGIEFAFEKGKTRHLLMCMNLIHTLVAKKIITKNQIKEGVSKLFSKFDEICVDIPTASNHLTYILAELLAKRYLNLTQICTSFTRGSKKICTKAITIIINTLSHIEDEQTLISVYKACTSQNKGQCLINLLPIDKRSHESWNKIIKQEMCLSPLFFSSCHKRITILLYS